MASPGPVPASTAATDDLLRPLALEIRHLRLVLAIAQTGGVGRAGERLHLTQSALSHQLREIERRLGVALFDRIRNRLVLTEAGTRLLESARRVLADVGALEGELRERAVGRRGVLRITTECYTCYEWLPQLLQRFERSHPEVEVRIVVEATSDALGALRAGGVDVALVTDDAAGDDVELWPLFEDELLLVVAPGHRLAKRRFVRPHEVIEERLLLYGTPQENRFCHEFLGGAGLAPREFLQVRLTEAIVSMVEAGLGVAPLARWAVADELRRGTLVGLRLGHGGFARRWAAATRAGARLPAYTRTFLDLLASDAAPDGAAVAKAAPALSRSRAARAAAR
jgi:LysR family transcriptional regulator for metE and metH